MEVKNILNELSGPERQTLYILTHMQTLALNDQICGFKLECLQRPGSKEATASEEAARM